MSEDINFRVLPARAQRALRMLNIQTLEQLKEMSHYDFIRLPNIGWKSLNAVKELLKNFEEEEHLEQQPTLRDQFAMAALQGLLASGFNGYGGQSEIDPTSEAYHFADAMLKAREVKEVNDGN